MLKESACLVLQQHSPEVIACVVCAHIFIWILHHVLTKTYGRENDKADDEASIDDKAKADIETGDVVVYRGGAECKVTAIHLREGKPYYTIRFADGQERHSTRKGISHKEETAGKEDAQGRMPRLKTSSKQFAFFAFVSVVIGVLKIVFLFDADINIILSCTWAGAMVATMTNFEPMLKESACLLVPVSCSITTG